MNLALELDSPATLTVPEKASTSKHQAARAPAILLLPVLAVVLVLPSIRTGWEGDDLVHRLVSTQAGRAAQLGLPNENSPTGFFTFLDGNIISNSRLRDTGIVPWWTQEHVKSSFFRPVAWLTHWLDYRLWPSNPILMHLHSLAWYGGLALVAVLAYGRLMGRGPSLLAAALLFCIDDAHATAAGWIANRNAVLAGLFGVATVLTHARWRHAGSRLAAGLAPVTFLLALLSSEGGATAGAFLLGYAIFLDRDRWPRRLLSLAPYLLVGAAWRGAWTWLGFGSKSMGLYADPLGEPLRFAAALAERAPLVLLSALGGVPAESAMFVGPSTQAMLWFAGVAVTVASAIVLWPMLRRDAVGRYFAFATLLAGVPCCVTLPSDRNLLFVSFAAMGLLGRYVAKAPGGAMGRRAGRRGWFASMLPVGWIAVVHGLIAPAAKPVRAAMPLGPERITKQLEIGADMPPDVDERYVVVVNPPSVFHLGYLPVRRAQAGEPVPRGIRTLGPSQAGVTLRRLDERTLHVTPVDGYLKSPFDQVFRGPQVPLKDDESVELSGVTVRVKGLTGDGRPASAVFTFDGPLEDASLLWLQWMEGEFIAFAPPDIGGSVTVAAAVPGFRSARGRMDSSPQGSGCPRTERERIEWLIKHVEQRTGFVFLRNGREHSAASAAEHLRNKWRQERDTIATARQFIENVASSSRLTGRPYQVRRPDGRVQRTQEYLLEVLAELESSCR